MIFRQIKKELILNTLQEMYPDAHCELNYNNHYELLVAIILSAQTTDKSVNLISKILFEKYPTWDSLSKAIKEDVVNIINPLGLASRKAINIVETAKIIVAKYDGNIPMEITKLKELPGIGFKTATVFLAEAFQINHFGVDTHVARVSKRLGLTKEEKPEKISCDLEEFFEGERFDKLHHQFIFFGRYHCKAKKPDCKNCKLKEYCQF